MIQGLNNTCNILRSSAGADDAIGGEVATETTIYLAIKCRVSNYSGVSKASERMETGSQVEQDRYIKLVIYPTSYTIRADDVVVPLSGRYANKRFLVVTVMEDSVGLTDQRGHIEVIAERIDRSRSKE